MALRKPANELCCATSVKNKQEIFQVTVCATRITLKKNGSAFGGVDERTKGLPNIQFVAGRDGSYMLVPVPLILGSKTGTLARGWK